MQQIKVLHKKALNTDVFIVLNAYVRGASGVCPAAIAALHPCVPCYHNNTSECPIVSDVLFFFLTSFPSCHPSCAASRLCGACVVPFCVCCGLPLYGVCAFPYSAYHVPALYPCHTPLMYIPILWALFYL